MNPTEIRLDALGFPIPRTFDENVPAEAPKPHASRAVRFIRRLLLGVAVTAAVMAVLRSEIGGHASHAVAGWLTRNAWNKFAAGDLDGAVRDLNRAASWNDRSTDIFALRGQILMQQGDLDSALDDFNKLVELAPKADRAYLLRARALQRLDQHDAAIRDASQAVELHKYPSPELLNARAYTRALAGKELDEALEDVDEALHVGGETAECLDTRGYIYSLKGEYDKALVDLDTAIAMESTRMPNRLLLGGGQRTKHQLALWNRQHDESMAVMYHHRGEVYAKMGDETKAASDLARGEALGYDPAKGVY